jgi:hypothetical protein
MKLHRNTFKLLTVSGDAVNTDQVGPPYRVQPSAEDGLPDTQQDFQLHAVLTLTKVGTTTEEGEDRERTHQSVRVKLQTSLDKVNWLDVVETAKLQDNGTRAFSKSAQNATLLTWVRAVTVLTGALKPNHTGGVWLVSDGPFRCRPE